MDWSAEPMGNILPLALRRYLALSGSDRRLVLRAYLALIAVDLGLRVYGFQRVVEGAQRTTHRLDGALGAEEFHQAVRYARWLETVSRYHLADAHCLHRSLV